jgi:thymidylate synthase (FAD)
VRAYLIAASSMKSGMDRFLADRALNWVQEDSASDAERTVEAAGRICYMSFGNAQHRRTNAEYVANLISQNHASVLEHATFTLLFDGVSRALTHQLVRHRIGFAYSQLSQQYHDESDAAFVEPLGLPEGSEALDLWRTHMASARAAYQALLGEAQRDIPAAGLSKHERSRMLRSLARSVLPNATATTIVITGNARAWRHVLAVRGSITGDLEMREYCIQAFDILKAEAPNLFADFESDQDQFGRLIRPAPKDVHD